MAPNLKKVLSQFHLAAAQPELLTSGLINTTYRITDPRDNRRYILQAINRKIFPQPENIAHNIRRVAGYLQDHHPDYAFPAPLKTNSGQELAYTADGACYRLFPFLEGSRTLQVVETPEQAYEAARQFGGFTRRLNGLNPSELKIILPGFHDLESRYRAFETALTQGEEGRRKEAGEIIEFLQEQQFMVDQYRQVIADPDFRIRIMHFDTKISNVLFDRYDRGLAVIDLDTIMPGYFFDDVGDMLRSYLSPAEEDETDPAEIYLRETFYEAVEAGYLSEMADELSPAERRHFGWAGRLITYMQALRFLSDYLQGDPYYSTSYEGHNLVRAMNQATLYERMSA